MLFQNGLGNKILAKGKTTTISAKKQIYRYDLEPGLHPKPGLVSTPSRLSDY